MKKTGPDDNRETPEPHDKFPIVGVGASAGGLDALKKLLGAIPERSGMAFVLVQHSEPTHQSMLSEILQKATKVPVRKITNDIRLEPDMIYVAPSSKLVTSVDGLLKLTERKTKSKNLPIDIFFSSLAAAHTNYAAGVVLSGTGSDGTEGLRAIKDHGGICIAQHPASAAYDGMPQSAIHAGVADFVLPPEKIPEQLRQINRTYKANPGLVDSPSLPKEHEDVYGRILSLIHRRSGVDFMYYKQNTIKRRIARRMAIGKRIDIEDYAKKLLSDEAELDALFRDLLIPVTSFFRDPKTFDILRSTIFPLLFKNRSSEEPIRMWIAGCSTGEEAYSIAICLHEFMAKNSIPFRGDNSTVQIFATDISAIAIKKARTGSYTDEVVKSVSEARLKKYFTKNNEGYQLKKNIRDMCVFATHNFLKDPPFARMDLISCRNVLIYMDSFLQKKALNTFHYALKENGFLLLGKSESTSPASELFSSKAKHEKIYSPKPVPRRFMPATTERGEGSLASKDKKAYSQQTDRTDFRKAAEDILLSRFTPAGVIVNEHMDIVHIHGTIAPFLESLPGTPTFNLLKMAREGLAFELRNALHKAKSDQISVIKENVPIKVDRELILVTIEIIPLSKVVESHYLILFTKMPPPVATGKKSKGRALHEPKNDKAQEHIERLEKELLQTREDMRSVTEDIETANEELQSANEELQSSNEEMQSLNEELETSKEELQSTNEELITVNDELLDKQLELNASLDYSEAIIDTLREPFLVLDKKLLIQRANDSFYTKFNASESELAGKPFLEIQNGQWDRAELRSLMEKILPEHERLVDFELVIESRSNGQRTLLLNAREIIHKKTSEKSILFAIEDVTERRNVETRLFADRTELAIEVKKRTAELEASNIQKENLLREVHHRVKNNLQITSSLMNMQKRKLSSKEAIEALENSQARISAIALTHQKIYQDKDSKAVNLKDYLTDLMLYQKRIWSSVHYTIVCPYLSIDLDRAVPLALIISELVTNSLKHAYPENSELKELKIVVKNLDGGEVSLSVFDNGRGLPENFDIKNAKGIGFEIIQALCRQISAKFSYSSDDTGTRFDLTFKKKV